MTRIVRLGVILLPIVMLWAGCGGSGDKQSSTQEKAAQTEAKSQTAQADESDTQGRPMIPVEKPRTVEGLYIQPRFDAGGDVSSLAVAPGELFSVYICARHPNYDIATAQWRLEVPEGVEVLGETKLFEDALSMGSYRTLYVTTYPCQTGDDVVTIVKYSCMAKPDFSGGEFRTVEAAPVHGDNPPFLGFVTCGESPEQVPASGGTATLTRK